MQKQYLLLLFALLLTTFNMFSQVNRKPINGVVKSQNNNDVANVLIINLNTQKSTITNSEGLFIIDAKLNDSIRFTAVQYVAKTIEITTAILLKNTFEVMLVDNVVYLNDVTVMPYNLTGQINRDIKRLNIAPAVTSSTLSLPNANINKLTQSERLLFEADRGKFVYYYVIAMAINTHKIMNRLSGRTKSLKERVKRDVDIAMLNKIIAKFSKQTIAESFNIPETNIDAFLTYCFFQDDFSKLSKAENNDEIWKYLKARSVEFLKEDIKKE